MPENLNWNFNLMNGVAGPAAEMAGALDMLTKKLMTATTNFDELEKAMKKTGGAASVASGGLAEFGLQLSAIKQLAGPAIAVGGFLFDKAWDFEKKSIQALEFKETSLASFETLLGSAAEAQKFFGQAAWLGKATPFQTRDVVQQYQQLLSAGFSKEEVPVVFQMVGDAAALRGFDPQVMRNMTGALAHMLSGSDKNLGSSLYMFGKDAAGTGFNRGKFETVLAKNLGVDPDSIESLMQAGQIGAKDVVKAIIDQMAQAGTGTTGGIMKAQENTLSGIMSTLDSTFDDFFLTLKGKADDVAGFQTLKSALINLREALDTTKPAGKALQASVVSAFDSISKSLVGTLSGPDGLRTMTQTIEKTAVVVENLGSVAGAVLGGLWAAGKGFAGALGLMSDTAGDLFDGPMTPEQVDKLRRSMVDFGKEAGEAMGVLAASLKDAFGIMLSTVKLAGALVEINTAPTEWDKQVAWQHFREAFGAKSDKVEGRDYFLAGKDYGGTTYDTQGRATMSKTPGAMAVGRYMGPITLNIHAGNADPAAVGAAAQSGVRTALQEYVEATHRVASQAGEH